MPTPIRYPDTTGDRASFPSVIFKIDGQETPGFKEGSIGAGKRERVYVYGANSAPLGKTRGKQTPTCTVVVYVAEFLAYFIQHFGPGWQDAKFTVEFVITESGYDTFSNIAYGCTIGNAELKFSEGSDPLATESIDFMPVSVVMGNTESSAHPLRGAVAVG